MIKGVLGYLPIVWPSRAGRWTFIFGKLLLDLAREALSLLNIYGKPGRPDEQMGSVCLISGSLIE